MLYVLSDLLLRPTQRSNHAVKKYQSNSKKCYITMSSSYHKQLHYKHNKGTVHTRLSDTFHIYKKKRIGKQYKHHKPLDTVVETCTDIVLLIIYINSRNLTLSGKPQTNKQHWFSMHTQKQKQIQHSSRLHERSHLLCDHLAMQNHPLFLYHPPTPSTQK